uniref:Uncharacterized protein n=1 Tax=Arundo donax TaxID=35708 RepID=A0A0A9CGJ5_ARUDO
MFLSISCMSAFSFSVPSSSSTIFALICLTSLSAPSRTLSA